MARTRIAAAAATAAKDDDDDAQEGEVEEGRRMAEWVEDDNDDGRKLQPRSIQRKEKSKENDTQKKERNAKDVPSFKQSEQKLKPNRSE